MIVGTVSGKLGWFERPPGRQDVESLLRRGRFDRYVRNFGRDALGAVNGDCVAEIDMLGDMGGGQDNRAAIGAAQSVDRDTSVASTVGYGPDVAVANSVIPPTCRELSVVLAGDHGVPDSHARTIAQLNLPSWARVPPMRRSARARSLGAVTCSRVSVIMTVMRQASRSARPPV